MFSPDAECDLQQGAKAGDKESGVNEPTGGEAVMLQTQPLWDDERYGDVCAKCYQVVLQDGRDGNVTNVLTMNTTPTTTRFSQSAHMHCWKNKGVWEVELQLDYKCRTPWGSCHRAGTGHTIHLFAVLNLYYDQCTVWLPLGHCCRSQVVTSHPYVWAHQHHTVCPRTPSHISHMLKQNKKKRQ